MCQYILKKSQYYTGLLDNVICKHINSFQVCTNVDHKQSSTLWDASNYTACSNTKSSNFMRWCMYAPFQPRHILWANEEVPPSHKEPLPLFLSRNIRQILLVSLKQTSFLHRRHCCHFGEGDPGWQSRKEEVD